MDGGATLRPVRRCYARPVSELPLDVQSRLRSVGARYRAPSRRPVFFVVLYVLLVLMTSGALLARVGTPWARALAALVIALPPLLAFLFVFARKKSSASDEAVRAVRSVDVALSLRIGRASRLAESLERSPSGESVQLSRYHLEDVLAGVSLSDIDRSARRRGRSLTWLALGLLALVVALTVGRVLSIVEGLDVLLARRGLAPFEVGYIEESDIEAEFPPHVAGASRKVPVLYDEIMLPAGSEITWRMIPRVGERRFVMTDGLRDAPFVSDGQGAWVARLRVDDSSELRVAAVFGDVKVLHSERVVVNTIDDRAPSVSLVGGARQLKMADLDRLPIEFVAQDDYGLSLVELVVESGDRKERVELARLDGNRRSYRAATTVTRKTPLVQGAFQPVIITIQARDGDQVTGPGWGKSEAIVLLPEPIGESLAERHVALRAFRGALVQFGVEMQRARAGSSAARAAALRAASGTLETALSQLEARLERAADPPRGSLQFLRAQVAILGSGSAPSTRAEGVLLAVDVLMAELARADAERLSRDLGDVVAEVAASVHAAQASEVAPARADLQAALEAARQGAMRLTEVGTRGLDLGSVALGDLARARRLLAAGELMRAEAVLLHLAARLRRATPSFGSKGGGVESGSGSGSGSGGSQAPLSRAPSDYDRLSQAARAIAEQHAREQEDLEQLLQDAAQAAEADARQNETLNRAADDLRAALQALPSFGRVPGTALSEASRARSQGEAMADAMDAGQLERALEAGRAAMEALERARRLNATRGSYLSDDELRDARGALERARAAAENVARQKPEPALAERAQRQRELGRAAAELAERAGEGQAPLPDGTRAALRRAGDLMQGAAEALERGDHAKGRQLSAEAQEELERAVPSERQSDSRPTDRDAADGDPSAHTEGHAQVPGQGEDRSRDFRQRVEAGLGREAGRYGPAVRRYAETLK
jgi:hypothetical protein